MKQLNVRNIDDALWREVRRQAVQAGVSVGELVNRILADWLTRRQEIGSVDARERARRGRGIVSDLAPGISFTDELRALRQQDFEREQRR